VLEFPPWQGTFFTPKRADWLSDPKCLLFSGCWMLFLQEKSCHKVILTAHLQVLSSELSGAISSTMHITSWQTEGQLYLWLYPDSKDSSVSEMTTRWLCTVVLIFSFTLHPYQLLSPARLYSRATR
jgi:hypothetical protein